MRGNFYSASSGYRWAAAQSIFFMASGWAAPPAWWSETPSNPSLPPVLSQGAENNKALATVGQAKYMAFRALAKLGESDPQTMQAIGSKMFTFDFEAPGPLDVPPDPKPPGWSQRQHAPLQIGQLKTLAAVFYDHLHEAAPAWLDHESANPAEMGQLQLNGVKDPSDPANHYPWTSATGDDENKAPVNIGQLKLVFSLHFETLDTDYDDDGLTNTQEWGYLTNPKNADSDGDGDSDLVEVGNGTNPNLPHPSADLVALAEDLNDAIESRLYGKTASNTTRNVFSAKDHTASSYTRNANLWCSDVVPGLTGCAAWKPPGNYAGERYGGVMITPRHILFCQHAHPSWDGGWTMVQPQIIRFVKADGTVVNRELIANVESVEHDLCVGLLNEAVPSGIYVAPIMPPFSPVQKEQMKELKLICIGVSQAGTSPIDGAHESRVYPALAYESYKISPGLPFSSWWHSAYPGDSGTPRFLATPDGLALFALTGAGSASHNIDFINTLIEDCDQSAIQREILEEPTGLQVGIADIEIPGE